MSQNGEVAIHQEKTFKRENYLLTSKIEDERIFLNFCSQIHTEKTQFYTDLSHEDLP